MPHQRKSTPAFEEPKFVLAAPGSITPGAVTGRQRLTKLLAAGSLLAVAFRPLPAAALAPAVSYLVINLNPSGAGSLRDAISQANAHPGPDTVTFQTGLAGTIPITTQIRISDSVQIVGPGPGLLSVSGSHTTRVFYLGTSSVFTTSISGLTLRDGSGDLNGGGAIYDTAQPLTLDHVNLISNTTLGKGGAVFVDKGLADQGALSLRNSLVTGNHSGNSGGALALFYSTGGVQITNTQFVTNSAGVSGGGLFLLKVQGASTIDASTFLSNTSNVKGGAIEFYQTGPTTIQNTTISGNSAVDRGGGLFFYKTSDITIQSSTISGNSTTSSNPAVDRGGGVFLYDTTGVITIQDSTIRANQANAYGGGLVLQKITSGEVALRRTTISGNGAQHGGGLALTTVTVPVLIEDTTVSGNSALTGGGLYIASASADKIAIQNSTIVSNSATSHGGGLMLGAGVNGTLALTNTIIANNSAISETDLGNTLGQFQLRYDLVEVTGTATITNAGGNLFGLDPRLGPLADNGGPTQTHLPQDNSPVLDAGDPAFAPPPSTDQRGQPRVTGGRIDMGAVEVSTGAVQLTTSSFQVAEDAITATVTVTRTGGSDGAASVHYATGGGTATAGSDYVATSGTVSWTSGDAAPKSFPVTILNDNLAEGNETIGLTLSNAQGAALGSPSSALLTIIDGGARLFLPLVRR